MADLVENKNGTYTYNQPSTQAENTGGVMPIPSPSIPSPTKNLGVNVLNGGFSWEAPAPVAPPVVAPAPKPQPVVAPTMPQPQPQASTKDLGVQALGGAPVNPAASMVSQGQDTMSTGGLVQDINGSLGAAQALAKAQAPVQAGSPTAPGGQDYDMSGTQTKAPAQATQGDHAVSVDAANADAQIEALSTPEARKAAHDALASGQPLTAALALGQSYDNIPEALKGKVTPDMVANANAIGENWRKQWTDILSTMAENGMGTSGMGILMATQGQRDLLKAIGDANISQALADKADRAFGVDTLGKVLEWANQGLIPAESVTGVLQALEAGDIPGAVSQMNDITANTPLPIGNYATVEKAMAAIGLYKTSKTLYTAKEEEDGSWTVKPIKMKITNADGSTIDAIASTDDPGLMTMLSSGKKVSSKYDPTTNTVTYTQSSDDAPEHTEPVLDGFGNVSYVATPQSWLPAGTLVKDSAKDRVSVGEFATIPGVTGPVKVDAVEVSTDTKTIKYTYEGEDGVQYQISVANPSYVAPAATSTTDLSARHRMR